MDTSKSFWYYTPSGFLCFILPVAPFKVLPEVIQVHNLDLFRKSEFHVTIMNGRGTATQLAERNGTAMSAAEDLILKLFHEYSSEYIISFGTFLDDIRLATAPEIVSIAARCTMYGLDGFYEKIKTELGVTIEQPHHVSLYTHTGKAVGIDTKLEMESFEKLDLPGVQSVLDTILL